MWVGGWVGQPKSRGANLTPPPPPTITKQRPGRDPQPLSTRSFLAQSGPDGLTWASDVGAINANPQAMLLQAACAIEDDARPPAKGFVRATGYGFGYIATPAAGGLRLVQVLSIDPKGWIPPAAIDASNRVQIEKLRKMQKMLNK